MPISARPSVAVASAMTTKAVERSASSDRSRARQWSATVLSWIEVSYGKMSMNESINGDNETACLRTWPWRRGR